MFVVMIDAVFSASGNEMFIVLMTIR